MKTKVLFVALSLSLMVPCNAQKNNRAGVLPYAYDSKGEAYFLFGAEIKKGNSCMWSEFSGIQEEKDIDFPRQTAARVFNDGTRCFFGLEKTDKNKPQKPTVNICNRGLDYINPRLQGNKLVAVTSSYSAYLAQIDWVNADEINRAPKIYEDGKLLIGANKKKFMWVSVKDLMIELKKTAHRNRAKLPLKYRTACGLSLSPLTYDLLTNAQAKEIISLILKSAPVNNSVP